MEERGALHDRRRTGQTLAEFAITLPILLILLFGIIEFGRIFQAWVTLQNAARAAARYASTGVYDTTLYQLDLQIGDPTDTGWHGDLDSIVPCLKNEENPTNDLNIMARNLAQRGVKTTLPSADFPGFNTLDPVEVYQDGPEAIYATYYGGDDCDPTDPEDQNRRKDLARLLSIWNEARRGAAGLGLGDQVLPEPQRGLPAGWTEDPITWTTASGHYPDPSTVPWYQVWDRPLPGSPDFDQLRHSDERGWFDVMMCSSRAKLNDANNSGDIETRFRNPLQPPASTDVRAPVCLLEETPNSQLDAYGWTHNADRPWLDAGGPGDTVYIVVTFNHPLITPLGLAAYLPLQARRVAVNEAFRSPRAVPPSRDLPSPPTLVPSDTPSPTVVGTPTPTPTATDTPTETLTPTPTDTATQQFQCSDITADNFTYGNDRITVTINNALPYSASLTRVVVVWEPPAGYTGMGATAMTLNSLPIWTGFDNGTPYTDVGNAVTVGAGTPTPPASAEYPFSGSANLTLPPGQSIWSLTFTSAPVPLSILPLSSFNGTTFYFDDLNASTDCATQLNFTPPVPTDQTYTPTNTATLQCVDTPVQISPLMFEPGDIVRFDITNNGTVPISLIGFQINWDRHGSSTMRLNEVWGDGSYPNAVSGSTQLWYAGANQDVTPPTIGGSDSSALANREGTWITGRALTVSAGTTRPLYILFAGGANGTLPHDFPGVSSEDFANSAFVFDSACYFLTRLAPSPLPSATPTNTFTPTFTPTASNTPTPSNTPTNTRTPTATFTASRTFTPTNTYTPSPTFTPSPTPIPISITITGTCSYPGNMTWIVRNTSGNAMPAGSYIEWRLQSYISGSWQTVYPTSGYGGPIGPLAAGAQASITVPSATYYGTLRMRLFVRNLPSNYTIANTTITSSNVNCVAPTNTPSNTPTASNTPTNTATATRTPTASNTPTASRTPTATFTPTASNTPTASRTPTPSASPSQTPTRTPTPTWTPFGGGVNE